MKRYRFLKTWNAFAEGDEIDNSKLSHAGKLELIKAGIICRVTEEPAKPKGKKGK